MDRTPQFRPALFIGVLLAPPASPLWQTCRQAEAATPTLTPEQVQGQGQAGRWNLGVGVGWRVETRSGCARAWPGGAAQNTRSVNADVSRSRGRGHVVHGCQPVRGAPFLHARRDDDGITRVWSRAVAPIVLSLSFVLPTGAPTLSAHQTPESREGRCISPAERPKVKQPMSDIPRPGLVLT
jgi:hypothetical protein